MCLCRHAQDNANSTWLVCSYTLVFDICLVLVRLALGMIGYVLRVVVNPDVNLDVILFAPLLLALAVCDVAVLLSDYFADAVVDVLLVALMVAADADHLVLA